MEFTFTKDELYHLIRGVETDKARMWDKTTDRRLTKLLNKFKGQSMKATIQFETGQVSYGKGKGLWTLTKEFTDHKHMDNFIAYICKSKNYLLDEVWYESYPFNEGDTYYTIEETMNYGEYKLLIDNQENPERYVVVESCWDEVSEELFDENPNGYMTWSRKKANEYAEKLNEGTIKIY
jgi:hypothetical protein